MQFHFNLCGWRPGVLDLVYSSYSTQVYETAERFITIFGLSLNVAVSWPNLLPADCRCRGERCQRPRASRQGMVFVCVIDAKSADNLFTLPRFWLVFLMFVGWGDAGSQPNEFCLAAQVVRVICLGTSTTVQRLNCNRKPKCAKWACIQVE